jgi:hypothetical protein
MKAAFSKLKSDVVTCQTLEQNLRGKSKAKKNGTLNVIESKDRSVDSIYTGCVEACRASRKRHREETDPLPTEDDQLSQFTRFTNDMCLKPYEHFLKYVPRLVNVVTLAEALPVSGSGIKLPLNLQHIAAKCNGSFYAPRRFSAVQLAYSSPRCRVLVFHTGRLVGTGV